MRDFYKKIFIFSIPLFILIPLAFGFIYLTSHKVENYKISPNISDVFIGDSHIEQAVIDSLLNNTKSFSLRSESFYFSYYKLQLLLRSNSNIKRVYLGFSYHSLSSCYDQFINGDFSYFVAPKYFYTLPFKEKTKLLNWNLSHFSQTIRSIVTTGISVNLSNRYNIFWGGYDKDLSSFCALEKSMNERLNFQYYNENGLRPYSEINLTYLDKMIDLCAKYNVKLYTIDTPLHPQYFAQIPDAYIKKYNEIIAERNFEVIDFKHLLTDDYYFMADGDHLTEKGAIIITQQLNKLMKEHIKKEM